MSKFDSRWVYLAVFVSVLVPLVKPLGLPVSVGPAARQAYDLVESLNESSRVILSPSFSPSADAEVLPQMNSVLRHLMSRGARITWVNLTVEGVMYAERAMSRYGPEFGYEYGRDYVLLPFLPGGETAVASMATDFDGTFPKDAYGKGTLSLPVMDGVRSISDYDLVIDFNTGDTSIFYLQQLQGKGVKMLSGASAVTVPYLMPYLSSGQLAGLLGGLRAAAEYEMLSGSKGEAVAGMDAQSLSHGVVVAFILAGNATFFIARKRGGNQE